MLRRIELGGGSRPRGEGWLNVDSVPGPLVDVTADAAALPFADESVDAAYSSHMLEHCEHPLAVLRELCRVCRVGADVEVRVPTETNPMAMCAGHRCVISEMQVRQWCEEFVAESWAGSPRRLRLLSVERVPSGRFEQLRHALGSLLSDEQILRFVPDAAHEYRFHFEVEINREG